jgi:predicted O-methyltransferase YrrM
MPNMNYIERALRYVQAYWGLARLNRVTASLIDRPSELIAQTFNYCNAFLAPIQIEEELASLLEDVRRLGPKTVVEIGTSMGGTLYLWTRLAQPDAVIISVDLPGGQFGGGYSPLRTPIYRRFARERQALHLMRADSHENSTLEQVKGFLGGLAVDLLFIDGDHTYEGVRKDWEMYSPLVRPGGLVVFHDVAGNYDTTQVKRFWDEIKTGYRYSEYMVHPRGQYGIGVLYKQGSAS